jgi:ubiquitin C-terminal hydrolase
MTNSTTTGTSDYSNSSLRNGNSSYSYSTNTSKTIGLVGLNNIGNTCFM